MLWRFFYFPPMIHDPHILVQKLLQGDLRALSRVISLIEDGSNGSKQCIELLYPHTGKASIIGVTGSPGAGKSTLVDRLAKELIVQGKRVAVLAVDPSSPFSGGAILGDRIRMTHSLALSQVFIRSMASRGSQGGLAPKTAEAIFALDAGGFEFIIVETVGVGQAELEIVRFAHSVVVVMVPGMGDVVQVLKAGILEIADVFVINKADHEGADRLKKELLMMLSLGENPPWTLEIILAVATQGIGVQELLGAIVRHLSWAQNSGALTSRKEAFLHEAMYRELAEQLSSEVLRYAQEKGLLADVNSDLLARKIDPAMAASRLVERFKRSFS